LRACALKAVDADGDGYGAAPCGDDCDDTDPTVHPGARDVCNGRDDNCDGFVDEDRVLSPEIALTESGDYHGQAGRLSHPVLFWNAPVGWFASWPDVDCGGSAAGAAFACQQLGSDGSPIAAQPRRWYEQDGYQNLGDWPAAVPVGGGYLAAAAVMPASGSFEGRLVLAELPAVGPPAVHLVTPPIANAVGSPVLATNGSDVLMLFAQSTVFALPLDQHGNPTGPATDLGAGWPIGNGPSWDPHSSAFLFMVQDQFAPGHPAHALFLEPDGTLREDRVLPLYSVGTIISAWLLWHGSGYLAVWSDLVGSSASHYAMALSPSFEVGPPQLLGSGDGAVWGVAQRGDEIGIAWNTAYQTNRLTLVGRDARRRAPDLDLMPSGEVAVSAEPYHAWLAAGPTSFGVIELLADRAPAGGCAAQPLQQHARMALRILRCP
jgi:hypothetical protein